MLGAVVMGALLLEAPRYQADRGGVKFAVAASPEPCERRREERAMGKTSKDPKQAPAWASFFTPGQHAEFVQLVASGLAKRGIRAHFSDGFAVVRREGKPDERMGLLNLAQT